MYIFPLQSYWFVYCKFWTNRNKVIANHEREDDVILHKKNWKMMSSNALCPVCVFTSALSSESCDMWEGAIKRLQQPLCTGAVRRDCKTNSIVYFKWILVFMSTLEQIVYLVKCPFCLLGMQWKAKPSRTTFKRKASCRGRAGEGKTKTKFLNDTSPIGNV